MSLFRLMGQDLAVDLGAAGTRIYSRGRGIVLDEPSIVTCDTRTGKIVSYGADRPAGGDDASGPAGGTRAVRPVGGSDALDREFTQRLLKHFLRKVHAHPYARPRVVMAVPDDSTATDRRDVQDLAFEADARQIYLVRHALAAALGAGLPIGEPAGVMIIDIGHHTTRIAIVAGDRVLTTRSVRSGGAHVNGSIARLVERDHGLIVGDGDAEAAKHGLGTAWKPLDRQVTVRARVPETGHESRVTLTAQDLYEATSQPADVIVRAAISAMDGCPADLAADVATRGAVLVGGGSLVRGLGRRLRARLGVPVRRAERPRESVALGLGHCADDLALAARLHAVRR
ncbi:rod shape-determining protein [Nonomuraea sp. NPDC048916]|uniref:rod shape-determining protein n=1 Tax=Nonomuraea sp. NPDC048916 TaxID=3154232 RepID=UPI003400BD14